MKTLLSEARIFDVTVLGDGATNKTLPLVNVLAACVNNDYTLLKFTNCTAHLAKGGKKDAKYISKNHHATHSADEVRGEHAQEDINRNC